MVLELSGNQITRVEDSIGSMIMLKELDLSGNMLSHLSDALGMLPKLEVGIGRKAGRITAKRATWQAGEQEH
jgi:hypothetical protein